MAAPRQSEAERLSKARREFVEAMERGCTIPELRVMKARERRECGTRVAKPTGEVAGEQLRFGTQAHLDWNAPWMMRD
jgi:hypothetical protein